LDRRKEVNRRIYAAFSTWASVAQKRGLTPYHLRFPSSADTRFKGSVPLLGKTTRAKRIHRRQGDSVVPRVQTSLTTARLRAAVEPLPRFALAHLPTPLEQLPRFSKVLGGPQIYIKRDDCTGLVMGGNKARHNEFLFGDALRKKAQMFVW